MGLFDLVALLSEAKRTRSALARDEVKHAREVVDQARGEIERLLDGLNSTDNSEQEYWDLCEQRQRYVLWAEVPPEQRATLNARQRQRLELRAAFSAYKEAEQQLESVRRQLPDALRETVASPASSVDEMTAGCNAP